MQLEWLGRYRGMVERIIRYGNAYARTYNKPYTFRSDLNLTAAEIQTLEYVLENEELKLNMAEIAARLGVSPSVFSRYVKQMLNKGLLEKYHTVENQKDVIIQATQLGRDFYTEYCVFERNVLFEQILSRLDGVSEEDLKLFSDVLDQISDSLLSVQPEDAPLVKIQ